MDEEGHLVLVDFGMSKIMEKNEVLTNSLVGTAQYLAPEVVASDSPGHSKPVDVWSLGILIFEFIYGKTPFYDDNKKLMFTMILEKDI